MWKKLFLKRLIQVNSRNTMKTILCKNTSDDTESLNKMNVATVLEGKIVLFIGSAKIPEREEGISSSSFYGRLPDY